jgi:hypothetical protein
MVRAGDAGLSVYEHRSQPLLPRREYLQRLARSAALGVILITASLFVGMLGYHALEGLDWLDSFLNAAMLLGGMGPIEQPQTAPGKLFAGLYSLYCGLIAIVAVGITFAPVVHRFLHKFHLEQPGSR